ncbi:MAG: 50S ribosomal protein L21e [Candidatus Aenigmarchaeota archaeon]|nr:50S ribosomal protein L21e [Candidatus Aenigmarchaeota archaeon]
MVRKSYGKMRGVRKKLKLRKKPTLTRYLARFAEGERVHINIVSSSKFSHPRFHGHTGTVVQKQGRAYVVSVQDGRKTKLVYMRPEHLSPAKK